MPNGGVLPDEDLTTIYGRFRMFHHNISTRLPNDLPYYEYYTYLTRSVVNLVGRRIPDIGESKKWICKYADQINEKGRDGHTALMMASRFSKTRSSNKIVRTLLEYGADPNLQDDKGNTALMYAAEYSMAIRPTMLHTSTIETVNILLEAGADKRIRNRSKRTAIDFAYAESKKLIKDFRYPINYTSYHLQNSCTRKNMIYLNLVNRRLGNVICQDVIKLIYEHLYEEKKKWYVFWKK